jgi:hypothetical protein
MPLLLVPPTQVVPYDAERQMRHSKIMDEFRAEVVKLWNAASTGETKFGAFRRTRSYTWNESFDGLLQTYFIFPNSGKVNETELARVAVLFRQENCQMLGSRVIWGAAWANALPQGIRKQDLSEFKTAATRKFDVPKSPVRLSIESYGYWGPSMAWLTEAIVGEKLSAAGLPVHSDLSGLACFREFQNSNKEKEQQGNQKTEGTAGQTAPAKSDEIVLKKGHRQLKVKLAGVKPKAPDKWSEVSGQFQIMSLPFNSLRKSVSLSPTQQKFDPDKIADLVGAEMTAFVQPLKESQIKVSRREGRFVTIERGIAYGLRIGMHLSGPEGSKLHVIRFQPATDTDDAAILLIRQESAEKPLAAGAVLQIDKTQYPLNK